LEKGARTGHLVSFDELEVPYSSSAFLPSIPEAVVLPELKNIVFSPPCKAPQEFLDIFLNPKIQYLPNKTLYKPIFLSHSYCIVCLLVFSHLGVLIMFSVKFASHEAPHNGIFSSNLLFNPFRVEAYLSGPSISHASLNDRDKSPTHTKLETVF
jgi:hypothetical protein